VPNKREPITVPTDDYVEDGHHTHAGESVQLWPVMPVSYMRQVLDLQQRALELQAFGEAGETEPAVANLVLELCDRARLLLADRIASWSWTDYRGHPLPEIDGSPAPFERLNFQELMYLVRLQPEPQAADAKNASGPSPRTSSTAQGRNRTRHS
jgi:hypothetical protein